MMEMIHKDDEKRTTKVIPSSANENNSDKVWTVWYLMSCLAFKHKDFHQEKSDENHRCFDNLVKQLLVEVRWKYWRY